MLRSVIQYAPTKRNQCVNASIGMSETWKVQRVSQAKCKMRPAGRVLSSVDYTGLFQGLRLNTGKDTTLFLFAVNEARVKRKSGGKSRQRCKKMCAAGIPSVA